MKRIILIGFLGILSLGAVDIKIDPNKEINEAPVRIICPKCGMVFFNCPGEIFEEDWDSLASCKPAQEWVEPISYNSKAVICPIDKIQPVRLAKGKDENGNPVAQYYTNFGWMPTRKKSIVY